MFVVVVIMVIVVLKQTNDQCSVVEFSHRSAYAFWFNKLAHMFIVVVMVLAVLSGDFVRDLEDKEKT